MRFRVADFLLVSYMYVILFGLWVFGRVIKDDAAVYTLLNVVEVIPLVCFVIHLLLKRKALSPGSCGEVFVTSKKFWGIILAFLFLVFASAYINKGNILSSISHVVVLTRFIPFAYFVVLNRSSDAILRHIRIISFILLVIGIIEIILGPGCYPWFTPAAQAHSAIRYDNSIFGIYPNTVDYAYMLLAFFALQYSSVSNSMPRKLFLLALYSVLIYYTGSKAALLVLALVFLLAVPRKPVFKVSVLIMGILITSYFIYDNYELFYWTVFENSMYSRGGLLLVTLPEFLKELDLNTFIGVTSDYQLAFDKISSLPNPLLWIQEVDHMTSFEDCFYVALIVYYGVIGFGILVYLLWKVYRFFISREYMNVDYDYKFVVRSLFLCLLVLPLFGQILVIRTFSFVFWALMAVVYSNLCNSNEKSFPDIKHVAK